MRSAALRYAARGWPVLPLHSVDDHGRCDCGRNCDSPGKHPRSPNGFHDATTEQATIRDWWERWPYANVGGLVGAQSGTIVLDVDPRNGGAATLRELVAKCPELTQTRTTRTGGGGFHLIFRHPGIAVGKVGTGIDTKGGDPEKDNGYIVLPPSRHSSGARYEWLDQSAPTAPFPEALLRAARPASAVPLSDRIPEGKRNERLTSLAGTMRRPGMTEDEIGAALLVANAGRCDPPLPEDEVRRIAASISKKEPESRRESQATQLVRLAEDAELWHAPDGEAYATVPVVRQDMKHLETHAARSAGMRRWLQHRYFRAHRRAASAQAVQDALGVLEGKARFEGAEHSVSVRVAEGADGRIYVHLADPEWSVVRIAPGGWEVLRSDEVPPEIRFRRPTGMLALPRPALGGDLRELRRFANLPHDDQLVLVIGFLVGALRPRGPYPVLNVVGEQGSAKSTTQRVLKALIDPSAAPLRAEPRDERDLAIAASNCWLPAFDNVSHLQQWRSDALCRLATGGGLATRELYSDRDETIFESMRPLMINGIAQVIERGDLADRALMLTLPPIAEDHRRTEREFWAEFEAARPQLLGALYDAVACALRNLPTTRLAHPPRMADFATWVVAAEAALPFPRGKFFDAYAGNRDDANEYTLEASPTAQAILSLIADGSFDGTATELLARLAETAGPEAVRQRGWPKSAQHLGNALRRLAPNLRGVGVELDFDRVGRSRKRRVLLRMREGVANAVRVVRTGRDDNAERSKTDAQQPRADARDGEADADRSFAAPLSEHEADDADAADASAPASSNGHGEVSAWPLDYQRWHADTVAYAKTLGMSEEAAQRAATVDIARYLPGADGSFGT
ncbi:MAG: bifunctional DNA primase/polymerase [Chloroflexota bacterium]